jgi:FkbM family methyltransferase
MAGDGASGVPGMVERPNGLLFPIHDTQWRNIGGQSGEILYECLENTPGRGVVVQAGGNVGILANSLSQHFGHVYTFEPDEDNFTCLDHNVVARNVTKRRAALGASTECGVSLEKLPANCGSHNVNGVGNIPVATIDGLDLGACDLIVLDVEGYELFALRGAERTIDKYRPTVILEDKGLSKRYGIAQGDAPGWLMEKFGYRVVKSTSRDVILRYAA